jgi:hypothetical protein
VGAELLTHYSLDSELQRAFGFSSWSYTCRNTRYSVWSTLVEEMNWREGICPEVSKSGILFFITTCHFIRHVLVVCTHSRKEDVITLVSKPLNSFIIPDSTKRLCECCWAGVHKHGSRFPWIWFFFWTPLVPFFWCLIRGLANAWLYIQNLANPLLHSICMQI